MVCTKSSQVRTQLGGDVQAEVRVEVYLLVPKLDKNGVATLDKSFG